ncbi:MAG: hypothetical protein ABIQ59_14915 [Nocardioidaceae bacterium]
MGIGPIELLVLLVPLMVVVGAVVLFVVLSARPSATLTSEVATARRHAVTTSVLSVLVTVISLAPVGIALAAAVPDGHAGVAALPLAASGVALVVLLVGELTWPRPQGASRVAVLRDRSAIALLHGGWPRVAAASTGLLLVTLAVAGAVAHDGRAVRHVRPEVTSTASPFPGWTYGSVQVVALAGVLLLAALATRLAAHRSAVVTADTETDDLLRRASVGRVFRTVVGGVTVTLGADLGVAGAATHNAFQTGPVHALGVTLMVLGPLLALAGLLALAVPVARLRPLPSYAAPGTSVSA